MEGCGGGIEACSQACCVLAGCTLETHTHTKRKTFKLKHEHVHTDAEVNLHNHTKVEFVMLPSV